MLTVVTVESTLRGLVAVVLGTLAAATTAIPFSIVRTGSPVPAGPLWAYLAIAGGSLAVSVVTTLATMVRATATSQLQALTA